MFKSQYLSIVCSLAISKQFMCGRHNVGIVCMNEKMNFLEKLVGRITVKGMKVVEDIVDVEEEEIR